MIGELYAQQREAILAMATEHGSHDPVVPACPGWTVSEVVRHLTGLCDDWLTGNLEVYASPEWTEAQVRRFGDMPLNTVAEIWTSKSAAFETILDDTRSVSHLPENVTTVVGVAPTRTFPPGILVDTVLHRLDISEALELTSSIDEATLAAVNRTMTAGLQRLWTAKGLTPVTVRSSDTAQEIQLGSDGQQPLLLDATAVDIARTFGGRRSIEDIVGLSWTGDMELIRAVAPALIVPFFSAPT